MNKTKEFRNETFTDFGNPENRTAQESAIKDAMAKLGKEYPLLIGGEEIITEGKITSVNPAQKDQVIGIFQKGTPELAVKALENGWEAFEKWKRVPAEERAAVAFRAADIMRRRRFEVNAWMILEAGKSWPEADADTAEAIDFLDFYAAEMLRYGAPQPITPVPGEDNRLDYIPLGVGAAIPPWNFPMAILCGMTSAAWIAGNAVVLKPASTTPMMGWLYMEIVREAGLPDGVVNFLPAPGAVAGNTLVEHPRTRFISFTGSMEVGLEINEKAARHREGQIWIKRVVAEMGGKDSIIVDREVPDLDEAVDGVVAAAFGFQGQKCSACSRAIVDETLYDEFLTKLKTKVGTITQGSPNDHANFMGPVIDASAFKKIMSYMDVGKEEGRLIAGGEGDDSEGFFIQPTVFADIEPQARLSQEEIFGPILAVIKSRDWDHAMEIANNTIYGLTGAVYTKNQEKLDQAIKDFHVGNLYLNRKCTGALVGGHPFGGFNMSGTDSKAGGRDYLLLFLQAKNIVREGVVTLSVLIPVFNEEATIEKVVRAVAAVDLETEVVVVDDGSTDGTTAILERLQTEGLAKVFRQPRNRGKGAAVRRAITEATGDICVIQDADLEYQPKDFPELIRPILELEADAVYGSRFTGPHRVFLYWHYAANRFLTWATNVLYDTMLTDMETGYKAIRTDVLRSLNLRSNTFDIEPEITAKLFKRKHKVFEVPITYNGRTYSEGKKIGAKDAVLAVLALIRFRFSD